MAEEIDISGRNPLGDFGTKLEARIREDIKELLPEDALQRLIEKAVNDSFFKPRVLPRFSGGRYRTETYDAPSWFVTAVTEASEGILKRMVKEFVDDQEEVIEQVVTATLQDHFIAVMVGEAMIRKVEGALTVIGAEMEQIRQNMRQY